MGLDATSLGIDVFFVILVPGLIFFLIFKSVAGFSTKTGDFASICVSAVFGLIVLSVWQWSEKGNVAKIDQILSNPFTACAALVGVAIVLAFFIGLPVGWLRSKLR